MVCDMAPAVEAAMQRSGISLALSLSLSVSLFQGPEKRKSAEPAPLAYLSHGPFFLWPLAMGALRPWV